MDPSVATASQPPPDEKASVYSNYTHSRISTATSYDFLTGKIASFFHQLARAWFRRRKCLPLPLPPAPRRSPSPIMAEASRVLEDIFEHVCTNMHNVQKNLQYWEAKQQGSDMSTQKAFFMFLERGPGALVGASVELVRNFIAKGSSSQVLSQSASDFIAERVAVLGSLKKMLAMFLAQVYMIIDKQAEDLVADPQKSLPSLLIIIDGLLSDLEASIVELHANSETDSLFPLSFNKLTEVEREGSQWSDGEIRDALDLISQNLQKLDSYLSILVAKHRKPRKLTRYWVQYTFGAVGLSVCSLWLVRHSRLVGSPDLDNWIREAKESAVGFWTEHVEQPLLSIRVELFETFRRRHKRVMAAEEVQLTANSLHRMLSAFCEQTNCKTLPENASERQMLEVLTARYEMEMKSPIKSIVGGGELLHAMLIQVQKLKLDIETSMLELDQILKANEINFAILAAVPAFITILGLIMLIRSWIKQDKGAEGRGKFADQQRRLLIVEIEKKIMEYESQMHSGQAQDAQCSFGSMLYTLDRLYSALEKHAKLSIEWPSLREDLMDLAKPNLILQYKLNITRRMTPVYDSLLPLPKQ